MSRRSQHSLPLKGRQGREAALHTHHRGSMLALPPSPAPMRGVGPKRSVSPVAMKPEGCGPAAATATVVAAGAASSPRLMQVAACLELRGAAKDSTCRRHPSLLPSAAVKVHPHPWRKWGPVGVAPLHWQLHPFKL